LLSRKASDEEYAAALLGITPHVLEKMFGDSDAS
jgi:hypothetical protein